MGWPGPADYNEALQNPKAAFRDPRLKDCAVETRPGKPLPWPRAGANAIVYRLQNGAWSTAVRGFLAEPKPARQSRYQLVHSYLQKTKPKCTVDFGYKPDGIQVNGRWLPVLTMEWVQGKTLGIWFREAVERQDSAAIKQMAHEWIKLICELRSHQIAHCDLQHGNIMVKDDRLLLVDYDGMFVPTMDTGVEEDRVAWEYGLPEYQHPERPGQLLSSAIDDFSAWVILISLRAVADDLSLWHRMIGQGDKESLLFSKEDIKFPARSPLWPELIHGARDRRVREWSAALRHALDRPFAEIPPFDIDIFGALREVVRAGDWTADPRAGDQSIVRLRDVPARPVPEGQRGREAGQPGPAIRGEAPRRQAEGDRGGVPARPARRLARRGDAGPGPGGQDGPDAPRRAGWRRGIRPVGEAPGGTVGPARARAQGDRRGGCVPDQGRDLEEAARGGATARAGRPQRGAGAGDLRRLAGHPELGGHREAEPHRSRADGRPSRPRRSPGSRPCPPARTRRPTRHCSRPWTPAASTLTGCPEADAYRVRAEAARKRMRTWTS